MTEAQAVFCILSFAFGAFGGIFGFYRWLCYRDAQAEIASLRHLASYNLKR